jgi:uncharacterized protein YndB with AHSA1/START domain
VQLYGCVFNLPHTVSRSVLLEAAPTEVWEALTDAGALSEWLAPEVELDPHEGGELVCRYEDGSERRGEVELVKEAERLAFQWRREGSEPSRVELLLDAVADGTRVTVIETAGRSAPTAAACGAGWERRLGRLRALGVERLVFA